MYNDGHGEVLDRMENGDHFFEIVSINGADIGEAKLLKKRS